MGLAGGALAGLAALVPLSGFAADHIDSPATTAEPTADITDVYAWMNADADKLNLVMDVHHQAGEGTMFSDAVDYVFHLGSTDAYGGELTGMDIICSFYAADGIECWAGDEYVSGDASDPEGIASESGMMRVFAGRRDDPFFFELGGFKETVSAVVAAAPDLDFVDGCPTLDAETANALASQLAHGPDGADPSNSFAGSSILALVVELDKSLVTEGGPIVGVWGSTHAKQ
jgi:hypothetical protein